MLARLSGAGYSRGDTRDDRFVNRGRAEALTVFGNLSRSTEPPSFGELSGGPNITQVDEQRADSAELGLRFADQHWVVDAVAWRRACDWAIMRGADCSARMFGS